MLSPIRRTDDPSVEVSYSQVHRLAPLLRLVGRCIFNPPTGFKSAERLLQVQLLHRVHQLPLLQLVGLLVRNGVLVECVALQELFLVFYALMREDHDDVIKHFLPPRAQDCGLTLQGCVWGHVAQVEGR